MLTETDIVLFSGESVDIDLDNSSPSYLEVQVPDIPVGNIDVTIARCAQSKPHPPSNFYHSRKPGSRVVSEHNE